ncbi:MAG: hypothetical protein WC761_07265 [Candidatus Paceibacterota bacterium]|jgi:hypothetical protein
MKKTVRIRLGDLKRVLREQFLREAEENDEEGVSVEEVEEGEDSLDSQVDKYFIDYEQEAQSMKAEGLDWRRTVKRLLGEADDEESDEVDEPAEGSEVSDSPDEPKKPSLNDINVETFVNSVVRLVENHENLLEIRNTVLRRAANFLAKNYDDTVVKQFKDKLEEAHGIEIGKSQRDHEDEEFAAPKAGAAGPFGGGAGGAVG